MSRVDLIPETILACCVLHNICLDGLDNNIEDYVENNEIHNNNEKSNEELNIEEEEMDGINTVEGINKRNYIAETLNVLHNVD